MEKESKNLIEKSKEIFSQLNISDLQKAGIEREDIKISSHSHHIVTYPSLDALPEINHSEIYSPASNHVAREIALYLHLPFCTGRCLYCSYITLVNQPKEFIDTYIEVIEKEIDLLKKTSAFDKTIINSIYIGGGTPTYLSSEQLKRVLTLLKTKFELKKDAEVTIEAGPETIAKEDGKEKLKTALENGVNRLSIGFQTFNDDILKFINRRHNSRQAIDCFRAARDVGFKNINIDLIPGLPNQTLKIWKNDLEQVVKLKPDSITCYPLSIKQTAGLWTIFKKDPKVFPSREEVIIMHIMATEFLGGLNYSQRPVWWFTKNPQSVYKQQIYKWGELGEQLALGVSGYSFIDDFQYFNYRAVSQYLQAINENKLPIWKGIKLSENDLMRRLILLGLKTGLSKQFFRAKFNKEPKDVFKDVWKRIEDLGLIDENKDFIQLSYKGKLFADEVSREFYDKKRVY